MKTKLPVYNLKGEKIKEIELPEVFVYKFNEPLVHQVLRWHLNKTHYSFAHTKTRAEVRGGGRKPWPQKGTGRARHGSIRSPLWKGGGVTFGPRNEKKYEFKIPKKMRINALRSLLFKKIKDNEVMVFDELNSLGKKTKEINNFLENILGKKKKKSVTIALCSRDLIKSCRNIEGVFATEVRNLNLKDLLNHKYLFLDLCGIEILEKRFKI
jgi:large subunit ribosomal protein L4